MTSPGNLFILGQKVMGHKNIAGVGLSTLVSAGFFGYWFFPEYLMVV